MLEEEEAGTREEGWGTHPGLGTGHVTLGTASYQVLAPTPWGRDCHYPHFTNENNGERWYREQDYRARKEKNLNLCHKQFAMWLCSAEHLIEFYLERFS